MTGAVNILYFLVTVHMFLAIASVKDFETRVGKVSSHIPPALNLFLNTTILYIFLWFGCFWTATAFFVYVCLRITESVELIDGKDFEKWMRDKEFYLKVVRPAGGNKYIASLEGVRYIRGEGKYLDEAINSLIQKLSKNKIHSDDKDGLVAVPLLKHWNWR